MSRRLEPRRSWLLGRLVLPVALLLVCSFAGCGTSEPDLTWQRVQAHGVIRVGMEPNWVPFEYVDGGGQLSGFDVALAQELGNRLRLEEQFVANLSFDGLYDALTARRVDVVISAVVIDMAHSADFAYTTPYFAAGQVLVVGPTAEGIKGIEGLDGGRLAVVLGSDGDTIARRWARRVADLSLIHTDSADGALAAVANRQADAAIVDRATALMALKPYKGTAPPRGQLDGLSEELRISGPPLTGEQYAIVVRKESTEVLRALNTILAEMDRDGTLKRLEREWLGP